MLDERPASSRPITVFLVTEIIGCRQEDVGSRLDRLVCLVQGSPCVLGRSLDGKNFTIDNRRAFNPSVVIFWYQHLHRATASILGWVVRAGVCESVVETLKDQRWWANRK